LALTPAQNEALIREIDDAVRQDDVRHFWRRYGVLLAVVIVLGLAAFGGYLVWQDQKRQKSVENAARFSQVLAGLAADKVDEPALAELSKAEQPGYKAAALLTRAGIESAKGDQKAAIAALGAIAGDASLPQPYRDLALIRKTALEFDSLPPQTVIYRLKPMAEAGNPWFGSAAEMSALAYLKLGKPDLAGALFAAMAGDPGVPRTLQTRAVQMASLLGVDAKIATAAGAPKENTVNAQ
jgi:hypothetical protein